MPKLGYGVAARHCALQEPERLRRVAGGEVDERGVPEDVRVLRLERERLVDLLPGLVVPARPGEGEREARQDLRVARRQGEVGLEELDRPAVRRLPGRAPLPLPAEPSHIDS